MTIIPPNVNMNLLRVLTALTSKVFFFIGIIFLLTQCNNTSDECVFQPDVDKTISFDFEQLESALASIKTKDEFVKLLSDHPVLRDDLMGRANYPDDSVFINSNFKRFTHPAFDTLLLETQRVFGDGSALKKEFEQAFTNLKYYYPDFNPPRVETVITGLASDLVVTDSVIVISLDYYLGQTGKYRPELYNYLLTRYEPEDIVTSCMMLLGIGDAYNKTNLQDKTALADMIAYGKSFYFAKHMLPCVPDSVFMWYSSEEIKGARKNEDLIWARLIEDQVLFATSHMVKQKYLDERPKTLEVGEKCPGRIAQWVGWQIVKKYMETHPDVDLPALMQTEDAQMIFKESRYKPK